MMLVIKVQFRLRLTQGTECERRVEKRRYLTRKCSMRWQMKVQYHTDELDQVSLGYQISLG
jgi:hypothetical protein